jgi:hypothetical protein
MCLTLLIFLPVLHYRGLSPWSGDLVGEEWHTEHHKTVSCGGLSGQAGWSKEGEALLFSGPIREGPVGGMTRQQPDWFIEHQAMLRPSDIGCPSSGMLRRVRTGMGKQGRQRPHSRWGGDVLRAPRS